VDVGRRSRALPLCDDGVYPTWIDRTLPDSEAAERGRWHAMMAALRAREKKRPE